MSIEQNTYIPHHTMGVSGSNSTFFHYGFETFAQAQAFAAKLNADRQRYLDEGGDPDGGVSYPAYATLRDGHHLCELIGQCWDHFDMTEEVERWGNAYSIREESDDLETLASDQLLVTHNDQPYKSVPRYTMSYHEDVTLHMIGVVEPV